MKLNNKIQQQEFEQQMNEMFEHMEKLANEMGVDLEQMHRCHVGKHVVSSLFSLQIKTETEGSSNINYFTVQDIIDMTTEITGLPSEIVAQPIADNMEYLVNDRLVVEHHGRYRVTAIGIHLAHSINSALDGISR